MNTVEKLRNLKNKALHKSQTLKSLRAEFIELCAEDKELAALEHNQDWCTVGGNSVEQARKTKGFDVFALHVNKIIDILDPFDFDLFEDFA
ncbi:hypothetical protein [Vibrio phage vB_VneS_J26]